MLGDGEGAAFLQVGLRGPESGVGRVALWRGGQINGGVGQRDLRLGQAEKFAGLLGGDGEEQPAGVGQADILAGGNDEAPGNEADVFPGMEHFGQPIERGIGIAAADAFDEGADRIVVRIILGIVDHGFALDAFLDDGAGQADGAIRRRFGGQRGQLEGVEAAAGVPVADLGQMRGGLLIKADLPGAQTAFRIGQSTVQEGAQIGRRERTKLEDERAGDKRAVDVEKWIHRRRPDQPHRAALHVGKEDILLGFVEAVNFVDEEHGAGAVAGEAQGGGGHDLAHFGHRALHAAQALEAGVGGAGDDFGQAGLARAGRTVEDDGRKPVGFDGATEKFAGPEDVFLSGVFVQGSRPHPLGQRGVGRRGRGCLGGEKVVGGHNQTNLAWTRGGARRILPDYGGLGATD